MKRRRYLYGMTSAAALLAGCNGLPVVSDTETDDGGTDESDPPPVQAVEEYYRALNAGNVTAANELLHPESPQEGVPQEQADYLREELSVAVRSASLVERDGGQARVDVTVAIEQTESDETQEQSLVVELRETADGWLLYDSRPQETPDEPEPTVVTPEEPVGQASRLRVVGQTGVNIQNREIGVVEVVVAPRLGAGAIDLSALTVEWLDGSGVYRLTYGSQAESEAFGVERIRDDNDSLSGSRPILDAAEDRALLRFDVAAVRGSGLSEGETVTATFTTGSGGTTETALVVPNSLTNQRAVQL